MTSRTTSRTTIRGSGSCAPAGTAAMRPAITNGTVSRMSRTLLLEPGDDPRRSGLVAFSHFVDERHRVLQQRDLRLEVLDQALLRRLVRRLRSHGGAALADRLIDHGEVLAQRRRGRGIELVLLRVGDLLEALDRVLVVRLGLAQLRFDARGIGAGDRRARLRLPVTRRRAVARHVPDTD